jgi:serine/threonine protein kinase/Tfp pilus assembly protein PilF
MDAHEANPPDSPFAETRSHGVLEEGAVLGSYRLVGRIGQGGMGTVWLAEQFAPVRRRVALKLIRPGMDTDEVMARFQSERQAIAVMEHPSIARVYEAASTPDGRPYFAMEYVEGEAITTYCDRNRLSVRARVELFIQVADGVQHAHQKAILHRDLKPSNILVAEQDGKPVPKVIDFGLAKAIGSRDEELTRFTQAGNLMGTPKYMSPEQTLFSGARIDTRSDVFSLGIVLYELLTGSTPYDTPSSAPRDFETLVRRIREEDPPAPSSVLTRITSRKADIAGARQADAALLRRQLSGDLDWIVLKALEKEPERRYASASDLAADLRRFLDNEPVLARPPSTLYRGSKFVRRHRMAVSFAAALLLLMIGSTVSLVVGARRTARERDRANQEAETARQVSEFMVGLFKVPDPSQARGNSITAREILDRGSSQIRSQLATQPVVQSRLMSTIGDVYAGLGLYAQAEPLLKDALERSRKSLGPHHSVTLGIAAQLAALENNLGHYPEAEKLLTATLDDQKRLAGGGDDATTLRTESILGSVYYHQGRYSDAEQLLSRAVDAGNSILGHDHPTMFSLISALASTYDGEHALAKEEALWRDLLERERRVLGPDDPNTIGTAQNLAYTLRELDRPAEAEPLLRDALAASTRVLGPEHPNTLRIRSNLADVLAATNRADEAEKMHRETLDARRRLLGPDSLDTLFSMNNLANVLCDEGKYAEAEVLFTQALHGEIKALGENHPEVGYVWYNLARVAAGSGRASLAYVYLDSAMEHGWATADDLKNDKQWKPLEKDPAFQSYLLRVREREQALQQKSS